jgi:hypothetical protein
MEDRCTPDDTKQALIMVAAQRTPGWRPPGFRLWPTGAGTHIGCGEGACAGKTDTLTSDLLDWLL